MSIMAQSPRNIGLDSHGGVRENERRTVAPVVCIIGHLAHTPLNRTFQTTYSNPSQFPVPLDPSSQTPASSRELQCCSDATNDTPALQFIVGLDRQRVPQSLVYNLDGHLVVARVFAHPEERDKSSVTVLSATNLDACPVMYGELLRDCERFVKGLPHTLLTLLQQPVRKRRPPRSSDRCHREANLFGV